MIDITVIELKKRMDDGEQLTIIDVREPWEYEEFNIGAQLVPLGELPNKLIEMEDYKDQEIILHCKSGGRSGNAKLFMQAQGFSRVRNLIGGMLDWKVQFPNG